MLIGGSLTFVAGAVDAGGVLLMGQPTPHLSSTVSGIGNHLLAGTGPALQDGLLAFVAFTAGGAASGSLRAAGLGRSVCRSFAGSILLVCAILVVCGILGSCGFRGFTWLDIVLLAFAMGMQNAAGTIFFASRLRTTHIIGAATDPGIALASLPVRRRRSGDSTGPSRGTAPGLQGPLSLLGGFLVGGVAGTTLFSQLELAGCIPLAIVPALVAIGVARPPRFPHPTPDGLDEARPSSASSASPRSAGQHR